MYKKTYDYGHYLERLFPDEKRDIKHSVKSITFIVTEDCSMRCTYCYQHNKSSNHMNFETAKTFIDYLLSGEKGFDSYIDSKNCLGCILDFIGGEPFLEIELIDQIVDYFREQTFKLHHPWATNFRISISSNGLAYFDPKVQKFIEKNKDVLSLNISIDGNKKLHDKCRIDTEGNPTYDRAMAAMNHYVNYYHGYRNSKLTIAPDNVNYLADAIVEMINNGYQDINLNCTYEKGWEPHHATILYYELKKISDYLLKNNLEDKIFLSILDPTFGHSLPEDYLTKQCGGTGLMIAVNWKGEIFPCQRYAENSLGSNQIPYTIGNLNDGIATNPIELERVKCLDCINRRTESTDECFYCPIASGCGECSAYNYEIYGTPDKKATFICITHKARVLAISYLQNMTHQKNNNVDLYELTIPKKWALEVVPEEEYEMLLKISRGGEKID